MLLPDYVTDTDPVEVFAYSDNAYQDLVFEESKASGGGMAQPSLNAPEPATCLFDESGAAHICGSGRADPCLRQALAATAPFCPERFLSR